MGAQWKHAGRVSGSQKRGALISKLVKEIQVAAKVGGPNIDANPRLYAAIQTAKKASVPRDTLDRAIKRGSGELADGMQYELITYEGFAPHQVPLIIECLTENKNRTAADIRVLFRQGQLSPVGYMFDRTGVVEGTHPDTSQDREGVAIEVGAQNVEPLEAEDTPPGHLGARFFCETTDLNSVTQALKTAGWNITQSEMSYQAKNPVEVADPAQKDEVTNFISKIDDHDDVHRVYVALR